MMAHDIIVVGGSAGGVPALQALLGALPADLPASIFVLLHRAGFDGLVRVLQRSTPLVVVEPDDRAPIAAGRVYVAPSRTHLMLEHGVIRLDSRVEPSASRVGVDTLFRSAALAYGARVAAVVLTGALNDGSAGLWDVRRHGGVTIVQDPSEAQMSAMPLSALQTVPVHCCLPIGAIARKLIDLSVYTLPLRPSPRVLVVEDEPVARSNLESQLAAVGYDVVACVTSGEDAVRLGPLLSPDAVLMDVHLAGPMRGTEAARILWERLHLPIVYVTAYSDDQTIADAAPSMPYGYVTKPCRAAQVHAALQLALRRHDRERQRAFAAFASDRV